MPRASRCRLPRSSSAERADAVLLGAVGGPKWSDPDAKVRPEQGLLQLRKALGLFANLRPVVPHPAVLDASPIKAELLHGVDIMVVRELTGGIYFGEKQRTRDRSHRCLPLHACRVERIVRSRPRLARQRRGKLTSVDKANVLETSRLWREVTEPRHAGRVPGRRARTHAGRRRAMHLIKRPARLRCHRHREHVRRHSDR